MQDGAIEQKHKFNETICEEHNSLNSEIYKKLKEATVTEDFKGMVLLTQRNKMLFLPDKYRSETAAAYGTDPVASNSGDEKMIKRKEAKATKDEKAKLKNLKLKPNFQSKKPFCSLQQGQP